MKTLKTSFKIKTSLFIVIFLFTVSQSSYAGEIINLSSPSGKILFKTMAELNTYTSNVISKKFNKKIDFEITKVSYSEKSDGLVASVHYKTSNGEESNYLIVTGLEMEKISGNGIKILSNKSAKNDMYYLVCDGPCFCAISYDYETEIVNCSCSTCVVRRIVI